MALKIRLKPHEKFIVNGCVIKNGDKRQTFTIENMANIIREDDLVLEDDINDFVKSGYYTIQCMLIEPKLSEDPVFIKLAMKKLAIAYNANAKSEDVANAIMLAAQSVTSKDLYGAMKLLRPYFGLSVNNT